MDSTASSSLPSEADSGLTPFGHPCNDRSLCEKTIVHFADNPYYMLKAYVDSKEGIDRAGGFAIQVSLSLCFSLLLSLSRRH